MKGCWARFTQVYWLPLTAAARIFYFQKGGGMVVRMLEIPSFVWTMLGYELILNGQGDTRAHLCSRQNLQNEGKREVLDKIGGRWSDDVKAKVYKE